MEIISGTEIAKEIRQGLQEKNQAGQIRPVLAVVLVGDNQESLVYVRLKQKAVEEIGGECRLCQLPDDISQEILINTIEGLNLDRSVDGILLQLPLPPHLEEERETILAAIRPDKDVDGFTPVSRGLMTGERPGFISCAALGCLEVMDRVYPDLTGKEVCLVGDSFDVIIPLAILLIKRACSVRVVMEYRPEYLRQCDIMVLEKGGPEIVKAEHIQKEVLLLDAGFYWGPGGSCGNVDRKSVANCDGHLLPVPGGLGPLLIAKLMENLNRAAREQA